jgi:hypothetical protein
MQPSPEHKQTSCGKDSVHETAGPGRFSGVDDTDPNKIWCTCRKKDDGNLMIGCDQGECKYIWLHARCEGRTTKPRREKWYCSSCTIHYDHSDYDSDTE